MKTRSRTNNEPLLKRKPPHGNRDVEHLSKKAPDSAVTKTPTGKEKKLRTPNSKDRKRPLSREDLICSQHFDSQVIVGWDCNSPDAIRNLNRLTNDDKEDDLLSRLIADEPEDELDRKRSTPPLLGMWRDHEKMEEQPTGKNTLLPNRAKKRVRNRKKSAKDSVSQALLQKLEEALEKCSKTDKETEPRVAEGELFPSECDEETVDNADASGDLFDDCATDIHNKEAHPSGKPEGDIRFGVLDKGAGNTTEIGGDLDSDVEWSDNDLFEEESFLVKPTQISTEPKKSQVFGMKRKPFRDTDLPQSKCFRASPRHNKDSIAQSASVNRYTVINSKGSSESCDNKSKLNVLTNKPPIPHSSSRPVSSTSTCAKTVASSTVWPKSQTSMANTSVINQTPRSISSNICTNFTKAYTPNRSVGISKVNASVPCSSVGKSIGTGVSKNVSMFGKQNVQTSNSSNSSAFYGAKANSGSVYQSKNSAFKKHSSFSGSSSPNQTTTSNRKRSISGNTNTFAGTQTYPSSTVTSSSAYNARKNYTSYSSNTAQAKSNTTVMYQTSTIKPQPAVSTTRITRLSNSSFDTSLSDDLLCQLAEPDDLLDSQLDVSKLPNETVSVSGLGKKVEVFNGKPSDNSVIKNNQHSENTSQNKQYRFKSSQKPSTVEAQHKVPVQTPKPASVAPELQSTSNKSTIQAKNVKKTETLVEEAMFADDMLDDDGFSDDEALTEPQILAMLDEAEFLATQQCATNNKINNKGDEIKNSQDRISNSQELMFSSQNSISNSPDLVKNSQGHINGSQGQSSSQGQGFSCSQGQMSSSQAKYTAAEIERKKLEAIQKRKLRSQMMTK